MAVEVIISTCEFAGSTPPIGSFKYPHFTIVALRVATKGLVKAPGTCQPLKELLGQVGVRMAAAPVTPYAIVKGVLPTLNNTISFSPSVAVPAHGGDALQASTKILSMLKHCALSAVDTIKAIQIVKTIFFILYLILVVLERSFNTSGFSQLLSLGYLTDS